MPTLRFETPTELGCSIPADTPHAVSVTLPTWRDNIDYEEGCERVISRLTTGYPRFFIHRQIQKLMAICERKFGKPAESCLPFPSRKAAQRCREFIRQQFKSQATPCVRIAELVVRPSDERNVLLLLASVTLNVVLFPREAFPTAKLFWQHTGEGISSRMAEYIVYLMEARQQELFDLSAHDWSASLGDSSRRRYSNSHFIKSKGTRRKMALLEAPERSFSVDALLEEKIYVEELYGRNLHISCAEKAKIALKRRILGAFGPVRDKHDLDEAVSTLAERGVGDVTEDDMYLFPCGMNSIFHAHRILLAAFPPKKSVCFGFPYIDTLKILEKFGPGCHFFGYGTSEDIEALEQLLVSGERILAMFCEFPSNPLLRSPDLRRLRMLADEYDFAIVVDETIGNFVNVSLLAWADIIVSSLTKVVSGNSNVMGGMLVLNPQSRYYTRLKEVLKVEYEDMLWGEDAIVLEGNSRTVRERVTRINETTETLCDFLYEHPKIKEVYYPKYITPDVYHAYKKPGGGYGGLFSVTFHSEVAAEQFYNALLVAKGPSLGTNFTLVCAYTLLAHYNELIWAASYGVERGLVRISVGLEDPQELLTKFRVALDAVPE